MTTENINFLSPTGFRLEIEKIPNVTFFTQECNIPVVEMYSAEINTPMLDYPLPGNKVKYDDFSISFLIDEKMDNYNELLKWLYGINNPESLDNNRLYLLNEQNRLNNLYGYKTLFSDGTLHILTNNNNENISFKFLDMFPISVSQLKFSSDVNDIQYLTCTAVFKFSHIIKV
jgi:hypothetical protein